MFGSKNNNILQLGSILIIEASLVAGELLSDFWHGSHVFL
jgi:hypothetical protein